jgi:hypothetical protein
MTDSRPIGGKNLNIGVRQGLLDAKHTRAMGKAIVLYQWLVCRQTKQNGLVLGGKPLTYAEISADTDWAARTVRRWMKRLEELLYISVKHSVYRRMVIRILNQKKFDSPQLPLGFDAAPLRPDVAEPLRPGVADHAAKSGRINHDFKREHKKKETNPAAKTAAAGDPRHYPFVEFAADSFRVKFGQHPTWSGKDFRNLSELLRRAPDVAAEELCRRFTHYLASTDPFIKKHGYNLSTFCEFFDGLIEGPILGGRDGTNQRDRKPSGALHAEPGKQYTKPTVFSVS